DFAEKLSLSKNRMTLSLAFTESYKNLKNRIKYNLSGDLSNLTNRLSYKDITAIALVVALMIPFSLKCTGDLLDENTVIIDDIEIAPINDVSPMPFEIETTEFIEVNDVEIPPFLPMENQPKMIGGEKALMKVLVYPELSLRAEVQGVVVVQFIVGKDGIPRDFKIAKSLNKQCDEAAIEGLKKMKFIPAIQNDKPVAYRMSRPIRFLIK
ncbi:MAG: energy transducer TonB, partial [bacterium]|nr:energy transducer TonB [bacterium]